jgi:hypothetical protein
MTQGISKRIKVWKYFIPLLSSVAVILKIIVDFQELFKIILLCMLHILFTSYNVYKFRLFMHLF